MKRNYQSLMRLLPLVFVFLTFFVSFNLQGQHHVPLDQWVRDYVEDLGKPDWRKHMAKYGWDSNYEKHQAFRDAYQNCKTKVIRSVTNDTQIMAWLKISAVWVGGLKGDILEDAKIGSKVEWEEVWAFNVIDGEFGREWEILKDESKKMKSVGINCLPGKKE